MHARISVDKASEYLSQRNGSLPPDIPFSHEIERQVRLIHVYNASIDKTELNCDFQADNYV